MKILYAIQATGNGHIARASELIPFFLKHVEVDILLSGTSADVELDFPIKYRLRGFSFVFGQNGGVDLMATLKNINLGQLIKEIRQLNLDQYDLIINDFEPVSAWASLLRGKNCMAMSHQYSLLNSKVPKAEKMGWISNLILKYYAPAKWGYGFHFKKYDKDIFLPVIKSEIKNNSPIKKNFYVVYLPAYSDEKIIKVLSKIPKANWKVFSKNSKESYTVGNVRIKPIDGKKFNLSMVNSKGVLCGGGFETPAEALYLNKKLLVIPMHNQFEQQCNAAALKEMGVPVLKKLNKNAVIPIQKWVSSKKVVKVDYSDSNDKVVNQLFLDYIKNKTKRSTPKQQKVLFGFLGRRKRQTIF